MTVAVIVAGFLIADGLFSVNSYKGLPCPFSPEWTELYASGCGSEPAKSVSAGWFVNLREQIFCYLEESGFVCDLPTGLRG